MDPLPTNLTAGQSALVSQLNTSLVNLTLPQFKITLTSVISNSSNGTDATGSEYNPDDWAAKFTLSHQILVGLLCFNMSIVVFAFIVLLIARTKKVFDPMFWQEYKEKQKKDAEEQKREAKAKTEVNNN